MQKPPVNPEFEAAVTKLGDTLLAMTANVAYTAMMMRRAVDQAKELG